MIPTVPVKVVLTHPEAKLPSYAKSGDAGADVYAVSNLESIKSLPPGVAQDCNVGWEIKPGQTVMVDLGLKIELPKMYEMQVRSRSGLSRRGLVVANAPGTIDSGYRGPCMVLLLNTTKNVTFNIRPGERVAQFVLKRAPIADFMEVKKLSDSERGEGGFGSTGK